MKCIELHKEYTIQKKIQVDGYCNSRHSVKERLHTAKVRSNRVKSYMITNGGLTESCFFTQNHADSGDFVTVRISVPSPVVPKEEKKIQNQEIKEETIVGQPVVGSTPQEETVPAQTTQMTETVTDTNDKPASYALSLRANLLRWATLTPDLGVEWLFANRWSVVVDGSWTSWSWDNKNRRYALWEVSPEVRYYFTQNNKFYLGAQYKIGEFNYKLTGTGKQGDLQGGGITFGYKLPIGKRLALDFNAAAGCLHTDYETYQVIDGVRVKEADHIKNVWGVTDLGVTLVWKLK